MKCPNCFTENPDDSKFCLSCGAGIAISNNGSINTSDTASDEPDKNSADPQEIASGTAFGLPNSAQTQNPYAAANAYDPYRAAYGANRYNTGNAVPPIPYNYPPAGIPPYMPRYQRPGDRTKDWMAISGMICGIASIPFALTAFGGLFTAIAGIVLGILGQKSSRKGMAISGICCAIVGALLSAVVIMALILSY